MKAIMRDLFDFTFAKSIKKAQMEYLAPPSVSSAFTWENFDDDRKVMEFNDGSSVGVVYELTAVPTEGQGESFIEDVRLQISQIFADTFPRYDENECPWIVSIYVSDDVGLADTLETMELYIDKLASGKPYTKLYMQWWKRHCEALSSENGLFIDPMTELPAKGCSRRIRMVLYRNITKKAVFTGAGNAEEELENSCVRLESQFRTASIGFQRYDESDFYRWMTKWVSPKPKGYKDVNDYLKKNPLPKNNEKPVGYDLTQAIFTSTPVSNDDDGTWLFDGVYHKMVSILGFKKIPSDGVLTAEKRDGKGNNPRFIASFDKFPEGSVFAMTIVLQNEEQIAKRIERVESRAKKSTTTDAEMAVEEASAIKRMVAEKNYLFPTTMVLYLRADDKVQLNKRNADALGLLASLGFNPLDANKDLVSLDAYLRFLPFNYNYEHDKRCLFRSKLCSLKQIASVFPVYGRSRGTGHPGYTAFNRQMEAVLFDLIVDRVNNAHMLVFGTTGSGKSAFIISMLSQIMAMKFPRMVLVDAGGSLRQLVNLWKSLGVKTNIIDIQMKVPEYSLNPFSNTKALLDQLDKMERLKKSMSDYELELAKKLDDVTQKSAEDALDTDLGERDFLIDFVAAAILMITGADKRELDQITRQDRFFILEGIKLAARSAVGNGHEEMIPGDLADAFSQLSIEFSAKKGAGDHETAKRYSVLENNLKTFIESPVNNWYFNARGKNLPEADVTWLELGIFKDSNPENEAPRALVFIATMNRTMTLAEKYKDEGRPTIFFGDEIHVLTKNPITIASVVQCAKMSRKVNLWIWLATQNVKDFPDDAKKIVSMMEYLFILYCDAQERKDILNFRDLTEEQQQMTASLKKEKGKYMENVMISNHGSSLFRNIPPREILAIAGTDSEENNLRQTLSQEYDCTLVESSLLMAQLYRKESYDLSKIREELCAVQS